MYLCKRIYSAPYISLEMVHANKRHTYNIYNSPVATIRNTNEIRDYRLGCNALGGG